VAQENLCRLSRFGMVAAHASEPIIFQIDIRIQGPRWLEFAVTPYLSKQIINTYGMPAMNQRGRSPIVTIQTILDFLGQTEFSSRPGIKC